MSIVKGQQAPGFTLYDTDKNKVTLQDYRGKNVVLLFFPLAFTSVCTKELCYIRDNIKLYNHLQATVFGISVDSLFTLKKFKEEQELNFTLLSDFNKDASKAYEVLYDVFPAFEMQGVSKRAAFVIDKNGIIMYEEVCNTPGDLPDFSAINKILDVLHG
ncbi:MAG TPA: redoxin domain-containing protein [Chitinophagaceae bacterium]|nr:redoxin domain-containing protein [Chitinophagaceae bacterium]